MDLLHIVFPIITELKIEIDIIMLSLMLILNPLNIIHVLEIFMLK